VAAARAPANATPRGLWCALDKLGDQALPTLMRKVVRHALAKAY
jgi:A/G-specific adenine glycosylase